MSTYGQFCPVAQSMEILGERWTLLVIRELLCGSHRFNDLMRGVPLMSRSILATRLKSLEAAGVIERHGDAGKAGSEYHLTPAGEALRPLVEACGLWAHRWLQREPTDDELDVDLLMWDMRRRIDASRLPARPVWVQFNFRSAPRGKTRYWLRLERDDVDLCLKPPGFAAELQVHTDVRTLTNAWMGRIDLAKAVRAGAVRLDGPRDLARAFPGWLKLSVFVELERRAARQA